MYFLDDLKANFRSWEIDHDNEESANELYGILCSRHPNENPAVLKEWAYDWVGYDDGYEWIDPAGGVHHSSEDDPTKMYE